MSRSNPCASYPQNILTNFVHMLKVMEAKENYVNSTATLDCKHGTMVTHYGKSPETKVQYVTLTPLDGA